MRDEEIHEVMSRLFEARKAWQIPYVTELAKRERNPFKILIATLLSLRTRDPVNAAASERLFALAETPQDMLNLTFEQIEKAIRPVTFYQPKVQSILDICRILLDQYGGRVPDQIDELVKLPGVGRKTANLVVTLGYNKPGICVDTHVHRITNRWGYVHTKTPDQTEFALRAKLPPRYWIEINATLVAFGQNICQPVSPLCSICPIFSFCERIGVKHSR